MFQPLNFQNTNLFNPELKQQSGWLEGSALIRDVLSPYSPAQVDTYLDKIGWPAQAANQQRVQPNLESLRRLMHLHLLAFPQDTSALHYTRDHHMPVTPQELYQSMVLGHRGSYCFGQNWLLLGMLRALGYRAYAAAGRVVQPGSPPPTPVYTAAHHLVLLVQPYSINSTSRGITYMVDVGFGGTGPLRPILFGDGINGGKQLAVEDRPRAGWVWGSYPPERHRLVRGALPESSLELGYPGSNVAPPHTWHLQVSHASVRPRTHDTVVPREWTTLYSFSEAEFFQADVDAGSFAVSRMPGSFFRTTVICTRRFPVDSLAPKDEEEVAAREKEGNVPLVDLGTSGPFVGKWNLEGGRATKRLGARVVEERTFSTEQARLNILKDVFGVGVRPEDGQWIAGWPSALSQKGGARVL